MSLNRPNAPIAESKIVAIHSPQMRNFDSVMLQWCEEAELKIDDPTAIWHQVPTIEFLRNNFTIFNMASHQDDAMCTFKNCLTSSARVDEERTRFSRGSTDPKALRLFYLAYQHLKEISTAIPALSAGSAMFLGRKNHQQDYTQVQCIQAEEKHLPTDESGWMAFNKKLFASVAADIRQDGTHSDRGGSTATSAILFKGQVVISYIGDSLVRIVDQYDNGEMVCQDPLAGKLHNKDNFAEIERLNSLNITLEYGYLPHGPNVFRNFGDNTKAGVIQEPDTIVIPPHQFSKKRWVILLSDGATKLTEQDIISIVREKSKISSEEIAKRLAKFAIEKGSRDNVSAVVVECTPENSQKVIHGVVCDGHSEYGHVIAYRSANLMAQWLHEKKYLLEPEATPASMPIATSSTAVMSPAPLPVTPPVTTPAELPVLTPAASPAAPVELPAPCPAVSLATPAELPVLTPAASPAVPAELPAVSAALPAVPAELPVSSLAARAVSDGKKVSVVPFSLLSIVPKSITEMVAFRVFRR